MTTGDKFQEYVTAALAFLLVAALVAIVLYDNIMGRPATVPDLLRDLATAAVFYYFGSRNGSTKLNGNVSKLADAAASMATSMQTPAVPPPAAGPGGG